MPRIRSTTPISKGGGVINETDPIVGAVEGIVKSDGAGNISAAIPDTDYLEDAPIDGTTYGRKDGAWESAGVATGDDTAYGASWDNNTDAPTKNTVYDKIETLAGGHDAVTLDADADVILDLSTQEIGLDIQSANEVLAGPTTGGANEPTFRVLDEADIPVALPNLNITESQISDLQVYLTAESDPVYLASEAASFVAGDKTKLDGIAAGAEVNVNADWDAVAGDAQILNKPDLSGLTYKGVLDTSGGSYPGSPSQGDYYIISVAGTISGTTYTVADWACYNGATWDKIDNTTLVITASNGVKKVGNDIQIDSITNAMLAGSIADSKLSQITTASKVSGAAITLLSSLPAGAGVIPVANLGSGTPAASKYVDGATGAWTTLPTGGGGSSSNIVVDFDILSYARTTSTEVTSLWNNQPTAVTELFGSTFTRFKYDTTDISQYRIWVYQQAAGATGADLNLQYSTNNGSTWNACDTGGAGEVAIGAGTGYKSGSFVDMVAGAKGDYLFRLVGKTDASSTGDPSFKQIHIQFKVPAGGLDGEDGTLADGDYGDITVGGSGTTLTIDTKAVTLAKMADMATASLIYRKTAAAGAPEVQTLATLKTDLGLTGTNSGDQTISSLGLDADLATFSLPANTTITTYGASIIDDANEATFKATVNLEIGTDVAAQTHAAQHAVAGTDTVFPADPGADKVLKWDDDPGVLVWADEGAGYTTLSQFVGETAWRIFYSNTDGDVTPLALGTTGKVLTTNGATSAPTWETPAGGLADGDYGDITVGGTGTTMTIDSGVVTLAKMANMATSSILGRITALSGVPEVLTAANVRTIINVADGANNYSHPNHSGEVTSVGDGAQTIANDAVTYAKMQNVSATDKLLGRFTAAAGDVEEIACTAAGRALLDDANAAAQIATLGLDADLATFSLPASTTISTFGASLIDDAAAANAIATLGLDADIATLALPASTTITTYGASIIDDANEATFKATVNLEIGVDVQAYNSNLTGINQALDTTAGPQFAHIHTDQLVEVTAAHGIDIDSWHIKDGGAGVVTGGTNTFNITNGTAVLDIAASSNVNIDANLAVEAASAVNQDLTSDASPTFVSPVASTAFVPDAASGAALGTTALEFSDVYVGTGRVYFGATQASSIYDSGTALVITRA